jgi:hypothetical protein
MAGLASWKKLICLAAINIKIAKSVPIYNKKQRLPQRSLARFGRGRRNDRTRTASRPAADIPAAGRSNAING